MNGLNTFSFIKGKYIIINVILFYTITKIIAIDIFICELILVVIL
jgi:hypothetical protein